MIELKKTRFGESAFQALRGLERTALVGHGTTAYVDRVSRDAVYAGTDRSKLHRLSATQLCRMALFCWEAQGVLTLMGYHAMATDPGITMPGSATANGAMVRALLACVPYLQSPDAYTIDVDGVRHNVIPMAGSYTYDPRHRDIRCLCRAIAWALKKEHQALENGTFFLRETHEGKAPNARRQFADADEWCQMAITAIETVSAMLAPGELFWRDVADTRQNMAKQAARG